MRYLLEGDAKALLAAGGVAVPRPFDAGAADGHRPLVVKVLVEEGRRALRGGVRTVADPAALPGAVERLLAEWDGPRPQGVHVEEQVDGIVAEVYLAVVGDRTRRVPCLLAGAGGIAVEETGAARLPLSPVRPWQPHVERRLDEILRARVPGATAAHRAGAAAVARVLVDVFHGERADLVEVNPLALLDGGGTVALDAKVVLPGRPDLTGAWAADGTGSERPPLDEVGRRYGVNAVDGGGDVAVVTSGAGLLLATVDLLGDRGAHLGPLVDLGGTVFGDAQDVTEILRHVFARRPRRVLLNYFLQFASCRRLAERAVAAVPPGAGAAVVVRQRGQDADAGRALLEAAGCTVVEDLAQACALTVPAAAGR